MAHSRNKQYDPPKKLFENRMYSAKEAASILCLDVSTVRKWVQRGEVEAKRAGLRKLTIWGPALEAMVGDAYKRECREDA